MLDWNRNQRTFCAYVRWRWQRRRAMLDHLRSNAANDTSRKLVDRLARDWKVDNHWHHPAPAKDLAELEAWRHRLDAA